MRFSFLLLLAMASLKIHAQESPIISRSQYILDSLKKITEKQWLADSLAIGAWSDSLRINTERRSAANALSSRNKLGTNLAGMPVKKNKMYLE